MQEEIKSIGRTTAIIVGILAIFTIGTNGSLIWLAIISHLYLLWWVLGLIVAIFVIGNIMEFIELDIDFFVYLFAFLWNVFKVLFLPALIFIVIAHHYHWFGLRLWW